MCYGSTGVAGVKLVVAIALALGLSACGYTLQGGTSVLPDDVRRVYIPLVENNTPEGGLALLVTEALRDRFERYGVLTVVDDSAGADAVVRGRVVALTRETRSAASGTDTVLQQELQLTVGCELRRVSGALLWKNDRIMVSQTYGATGDTVVTSSAAFAGGTLSSGDLAGLDNLEISRGAEQFALEYLADEVARIIYTDAVLPEF